tara:strand:+ start:491 stop:652 length:162 start_codon:yes stop_codon:yes gene_type:complete
MMLMMMIGKNAPFLLFREKRWVDKNKKPVSYYTWPLSHKKGLSMKLSWMDGLF